MRWPSFRRTLPMSSKVLFGVAGALSLASFLVVRSEVARADQARRAAGPMAAVVVAAHDLDAGEALDLVAHADVVVVAHADTALGASAHFTDVVLEAPERVELALVNHDVVDKVVLH